MEAYLAESANRALTKSALGKAIMYARNHWKTLGRYHRPPRERKDPTPSGNRAQELALSRQQGGRAAVLYTILAGEKQHRLEPWA